MIINKNSPTPVHIQLYDYLLEQIEDNKYHANELFPSENTISKQFNVSRTTVRNVLSRLANENYLYKIPGKGTFVAEQKIVTNTTYQKGIREQLEAQGYDTISKLLSMEVVTSPNIAKKLELNKSDKLIRIERVTIVREAPLSYHSNWLPYETFSDILNWDLNNQNLCDTLQAKYGVRPSVGEETLESTIANIKEAHILEVPANSSILLAECITHDADGNPYMFSKVLFRGDRIKLHFQYQKALADSEPNKNSTNSFSCKNNNNENYH